MPDAAKSTDSKAPEKQAADDADKQEQAFTQADVDRIVADRLKREREATKAKYADYNDLKAKADASKTLEQRIAEVEARANAAEESARRAQIANEFGLNPEERDTLLHGSEDDMRAQAQLFAGRRDEQKRNGNHDPDAGRTPQSPPVDDRRAWARSVFGGND